jgi:hypothetical protein
MHSKVHSRCAAASVWLVLPAMQAAVKNNEAAEPPHMCEPRTCLQHICAGCTRCWQDRAGDGGMVMRSQLAGQRCAPPKDSGDWMPLASPICMIRSKAGCSGLCLYVGKKPNNTLWKVMSSRATPCGSRAAGQGVRGSASQVACWHMHSKRRHPAV